MTDSITARGENVTEEVCREKIMSSVFGMLNLRPEEYTGMHGLRITLKEESAEIQERPEDAE